MERFAGRYALVRPLGQGGMGRVWLALDLTTGGECALKRLEVRPPRSERDSLRREFEVLAHVGHPAVVSVFELGFAPDGAPFYTMEVVPGQPAHLALGAGMWAELFGVAARVTAGLEALHAAGIVHGDVKPSNLLVQLAPVTGAPPASVRLVDFGLSARLDHGREGHRGTPGYAAPEVVRGSPLSRASDIYSLGATLFVLATGVARGAADGRAVRPPRDRQEAAVELEESSVPAALSQLILRMLSAEPEARPEDVREVRNELARMHPASRQTLAGRLSTEVLVGRHQELARLERWLALGARGTPLLLLSGELGVGRTTLLRALQVRAALAARTVVSIPCAAGARSGEAARTLLLRLAVAAGADRRRDPEVDAPLARIERPEPLQYEELPALVDAGLRWAREIARGGAAPLLLLDDVEALDRLSAALARRLVSGDEDGVLRWVWASGPGFAGRDGDASVLREAGLAETLVLGPLDRDHAGRLLAARLQTAVPPELADAIWQRCGGHPGRTVEALRLAADAGALREDESGPTLQRAALDALAWPRDMEAGLRRRWEALPAAPAAAATALAIWGGPASASELAVLVPELGGELDEGLAALRAAGLATASEDGTHALNPPVFADVVLAALPVEARARMHRSALSRGDLTPRQRFHHERGAGAFERALAEAERALDHEPDIPLALEAVALAASQAPALEADWEERAGRLLLERGRYRDAIPHLERAVSLSPEGPARARRQHALSGAYLRTGATQRLEELLAEALSGVLPDRERALLLVNRAAGLGIRGEHEHARVIAAEALALAESCGDGEAEGLALLTLGQLTLRSPDGAGATLELARRAAAAFARAAHELGRLRAACLLAGAWWAEQRHDEAEAACREALADARSRDLRLAMHEILRLLNLILIEAGRWNEARICDEEALRLALEEGWPGMVGASLASLAILDGLSGNPSRALRRARAAMRLVRRHHRALESAALRGAGIAYRSAGRLRRSARVLRAALAAAEREGHPLERLWTRIEQGQLLLRSGHWEHALQAWRAAQAEYPAVDSVGGAILALLIARAELRLRGPEQASALAELAQSWLAGHTAAYVQAHAHQWRAELALVRGEAETAGAAVESALASFSALPAPADAASAALEFARLAVRSGVDARAPIGDWLRRAADGFELVGDRHGRERALSLAVEWYRRHAAGPPSAARERDLLHAVARLLDSLTDLGQLAREAMRLAVEHLDAERGVLLLADVDGTGLRPVVEHGAVDATTRDRAVSFSRAVVQRVTTSGGSVVIIDAPSEPESLSNSMVELGLRSVLCVPLFVRGKVVGAVYLDDSRSPEKFGAPERGLLEGFAHLMAIAIENSRGQDEVRRTNEQLVGENLSLRREAGTRYRPSNFIGGSHAMRRLLGTVEQVARTSSTVLVTGENGTGKEMIARLLHHSGPRALKPFVAVNCGAIPATLLESELFGILADVATGVRASAGRFVEANGGTLFLDEVGEMPLAQQVALLRVLSERSVTPVGGGRPVPVDVRIIAASNRDLARRVAEGGFREDLWYRLNVIPIHLPPLRERKADIPALAQHFVALLADEMGREPPTLSPALIAMLMRSDWPGNVRELRNHLERLMAMTTGRVLEPSSLPNDLERRARGGAAADRARSLAEMVSELEKQQLLEALDRQRGNQSRAARELGLTEQALRYKLKKYRMHKVRTFGRVG